MSILSSYSDEEFARIVAESSTYKECLSQMGYNSYSGATFNLLKDRIDQLGLSVEHFKSSLPIKRTEDNIFIKDSTADQSTLRRWYLKGAYTEHKCSLCGQLPVWQGKELTLILDHINGIRNDDRLENLRWVCPNCNAQLDTTNGKNKKHKEHEINYCIDCGKPISKNSTRCISCSNKQKAKEKELFISREELKNLIRTTPFTQIGRLFNVSDNAVRKWCDRYNLPRKASEIKSYSDNDWEKI